MKSKSVNQMREENAIGFMMFAYFGIKDVKNDSDIISLAVDRAYRDAASHVLSFKNDENNTNQTLAKNNAKRLILHGIDQLQKCQCEYDAWHKDLCKHIVENYNKYDYNEGYEFTYGIAQKWVNMTIKYLYVIYFFCKAYGCEDTYYEINYEDMIMKYISDFHVPIDRVIIKAAKKDFGIKCQFNCWSKIKDYSKYLDFQKAIRKQGNFDNDYSNVLRYSPIDWEESAWIKYSTNR